MNFETSKSHISLKFVAFLSEWLWSCDTGLQFYLDQKVFSSQATPWKNVLRYLCSFAKV